MATRKLNSTVIEKGWGNEIVFANTDEYCGKLLNFRAGSKGSMHFHILKDETWYVAAGSLTLTWIDTDTGISHSEILSSGDVVRNKRGQPHQVEAIEDSVIFEVSTPHHDSDSYRVIAGDSQKASN